MLCSSRYCGAVRQGWRGTVGRIGLLQALISEFGVAASAGLSFDSVAGLIGDALTHASVKVTPSCAALVAVLLLLVAVAVAAALLLLLLLLLLPLLLML